MYSFIYYCIYSVIRAKHFKHERAGFLFSIVASNVVAGFLIFIGIFSKIMRAIVHPLVFVSIVLIGMTITYQIHQRYLGQRAFYTAAISKFSTSPRGKSYYVAFGLIFLILPWCWVIASFVLPKILRQLFQSIGA